VLPNLVYMLEKFTDEELLAHYLKAKENVFLNQLLKRYTHLIYALCLRYLKNRNDASDASMVVITHVIERISDKEIRSFKNWLYTITKNYCLSDLRKSKQTFLDITTCFQLLDDSIDKDGIDFDQVMPHIFPALNELQIEQRECIELFYLQNKSYQEVSEITGKSLNKVKSHIQNGKRNLKRILNEYIQS